MSGECKCRCRATNSCPRGQKWDSNLCACIDECTLSCRFPKIVKDCKCVCKNFCSGAYQDPNTCECGPCLNDGTGDLSCISPIIGKWSAHVIHTVSSQLDLNIWRTNFSLLLSNFNRLIASNVVLILMTLPWFIYYIAAYIKHTTRCSESIHPVCITCVLCA